MLQKPPLLPAVPFSRLISDRTGETGFPIGRHTAKSFPFQTVGVNHDRGKVVAVAHAQIVNAVAVIIADGFDCHGSREVAEGFPARDLTVFHQPCAVRTVGIEQNIRRAVAVEVAGGNQITIGFENILLFIIDIFQLYKKTILSVKKT